MELGSKSKKRFKFKSSKPNQHESQNWFESSQDGSVIEENDFGLFRKTNVTKTPVRSLQSSELSPIPQNLSPQFRVGWGEGSQKTVCDMGSPVSVVPKRRKIRRCPENLLSKISSPMTESEEMKNNKNSCDILQYINWAKTLIESTTPQSEENHVQLPDSGIVEITESIKDSSLDIALDDSSNELMIACSQAIEESVTTKKSFLDIQMNPAEKHPITPDHDRNPSKRFKPQLPLKNNLIEGNTSNFNRKLNHFNQKPNLPSTDDKVRKDPKLLSKNTSSKNQLDVDGIFKRPTQTFISSNRSDNSNNNNEIYLKNFNNLEGSCEVIKNVEMNSLLQTSVSSLSSKTSSALSDDDIKSHLNDEDDMFCSLDFNFLDSLQTKSSEQVNTVLKPIATNVVKPQLKNYKSVKLDTKPLVTKYTKEEIEKRRLEAKKRLLFNKKHRSM